ncbi:hypothetical protein [Caulobacter sp. LARHSG274]
MRGTVWQAILLGLSATTSHTAIVWAIRLAGPYFERSLDLDKAEIGDRGRRRARLRRPGLQAWAAAARRRSP